MAKKLLHGYTFDASAKTIVLDGIYGQERLLMISNITDNVIIYVFNQTIFGLSSYSIDTVNETTTLVLTYDTTSMSDTDKLQIFVEMDSVPIAPAEPYVDPVSKIRVTNPENLIDTDFEYGLQSTKWETLELVKNIPTFYSRNGDESLNLGAVTRTNGSEIISVTCTENHNLSIGNPIIVQGTDSVTANGAFVVTAIPTELTFQYKAKNVQTSTGSILDTYTQIFVGSVYQGTEFQLSALNSVTTDAANPSVLTVETADPTNFSVGTSFFLSNSLGSKTLNFDSSVVQPANNRAKQETFTNLTATDDGDGSMWAIGAIQPYNWTPKRGMFMIIGGQADSDVNFNTTSDELEFNVTHNFNDGEAVMWILGAGNSNPGGITERLYWVRTTADSKKIYLTTGGPSSISRVNLTSQGANAGHLRSCLAFGLHADSVDTSTEVFTMDQNIGASNGAHPAGMDGDTPYCAMYTTTGGLNTLSTANLYNYFETDATKRAYYLAPESGSQTEAKFLLTAGGTVANATSGTVNGIFVPMMEQADGDRNSFYLPKGGWVAGDKVFIDSTSIPGGVVNNGMYELVASGATFPNRFRLKGIERNPNNTDEENLTNYGGTSNHITSFFETSVPKKIDATGETGGWALGSVQPMNWLPEDAFFFVQGTGGNSTIAVNATTEQITFTSNHGLVDNKPYVYLAGQGNGVIGGLTDTRWYYVRVVDATTIYLTLTEGSTTKVNLTTAGSSANVVRSCFVKAYRGATANGGEDTITMTDNLGVTSGEDQLLMACYSTFNNFTIFNGSNDFMSYEVGGGQVVYPRTVTPDGLTLTFSNQLGGSLRDLNTGAVTAGVLIKVRRAPDANTVWHPNHPFETNDVIKYYMTSTAIGGMTNGEYYKVTKVSANRISFQLHTANSPVNFTNYGAVGAHYSYFVGQTLVADGDYILKNGHGLNNKDSVQYNVNGSVNPVRPLVDGTTYYVQNATEDKFQLSTTFDGVDGDAVEVIQNGTNYASQFYINKTAHGFVTGDRVVYTSNTPVAPLISGAYYYVKQVNANRFYLHLNYDGAINDEEFTRIFWANPITGTGTFQKTTVIDLETKGTGTQIFNATTVGSTDGVYKIASIVNDTSFTLSATNQIPDRVVTFTPENSVYIENDAIRIPDHYFVTGQNVVYTFSAPSTAVGGLTTATTYYIIRVSRNWIKLAASLADANAGTAISLTGAGSGTQTLTTDSLVGEVIGGGTVSADASGYTVTGTNTNFTSFFNTGDTISIYAAPTREVKTVSSIDTNTSVFTTNPAHGLSTGDMIVMDATVAPPGTTNGNFYYVNKIGNSTFSLHPTATDAVNDTNKVAVTDIGNTVTPYVLTDLGATYSNTVDAVTGVGSLNLTTAMPATVTDANFTIGSSLLMRADGFAIHRPYDGGVELIPSKNPDSRMIRQTRRYFRYQSVSYTHLTLPTIYSV